MMRCPNCNCIDIGKIAEKQYYCWNCFIEIAEHEDRFEFFQVESDGTLTSLDDIFHEDERPVS